MNDLRDLDLNELYRAKDEIEARVERLRAEGCPEDEIYERLTAGPPVVSGETVADSCLRFAILPGSPFSAPIHTSRPNLLDPETVSQLLRESVTAVKPGEVLFFTFDGTPAQVREIQDYINMWLEDYAPDIRVLVLPHGEMAAAEPA